MARALEMARLAALRGEVPVGAAIVQEGALLSEAHNMTVTWNDPTAHAEMVAIRQAARRSGGWRLDRSTLYVTLEPCAQCSGSVVLSRIPRVVYGAFDPKAGMAGSLANLIQDPRLNHRASITRGVLEDECARLLREFFQARRGR
jgi:tRNA(adenine34) deaminase